MEKRTLLIASVFGLVTFGVVWSCSEKSSDENISIVNGKNHTLESKIDKNVFLEVYLQLNGRRGKRSLTALNRRRWRYKKLNHIIY